MGLHPVKMIIIKDGPAVSVDDFLKTLRIHPWEGPHD